MLRELLKKKENMVIMLIAILFLSISALSISSINQLQGNGRVINYVAIVRGTTQKLITKELMGYPDDQLIRRLDSIIDELISGQGKSHLLVLPNTAYMNNLHQITQQWTELKRAIANLRADNNNETKLVLHKLSERYFELVDNTVMLAEKFSEKQVESSKAQLIIINVIFLLIALLGTVSFVVTLTFKRKAETLNKIAYIDPLTQMPNRACCVRKMDEYNKTRLTGKVAVFMFDMNNLKLVNDKLGHLGGDKVITEFAKIIGHVSQKCVFVSRYGGDEFVAFITNATQRIVDQYLDQINQRIFTYNQSHMSDLEKISFAVGYCMETTEKLSIQEMLNKADHQMYIRKRQMKERPVLVLDKTS